MKLNSQSIIAFARLLVTLVVNGAAMFSWTINEDLFYNVVVSALGVIMMGVIWWKNNNITEAAQEGQLLIDEIKDKENTAKHARG